MFWLLVILALPSNPAMGAEKFSLSIEGEADFAEGDVQTSRHEALEDALQKAVLEALKEEAGLAVLEDDPIAVRVKFTNPYKDFIIRSGILKEAKVGLRYTVTVGYELDRAKLKARLAGAKFTVTEPKPRIALIWVEEEKGLGNDELSKTNDKTAGYVAANWMTPVTAPASVNVLQEQLGHNGFNVVPLPDDVKAWVSTTLGANTVHQQFLAELARKLDVRTVIFVRFVRRALPTPRAARFAITRINHVAFVFDAEKEVILGKPIASPQIEVTGEMPDTQTLNDWINRLLARMALAQDQDMVLTVSGVTSIAQFDQLWATLRKTNELREVTPRRISAEKVQFRLPGEHTLQAWTEIVQAALPEAAVTVEDGAIAAKITAAPKGTPKK